MLTPIEDEPPVNGPSTPILIGSAAKAVAAVQARATTVSRDVNFMGCVSVWASCCCLAFVIQGEFEFQGHCGAAVIVCRYVFAADSCKPREPGRCK